MSFSDNIITGEKIQQLCNIYLGLNDDFCFNPKIAKDKDKHIDLNLINSDFNNPYKIFCYSHRINLLSSKIHFFKNKFILITHNSDYEVNNCNEVIKILECHYLEKWYAQNLLFKHDKIQVLPIGIANSQWAHGNLNIFNISQFTNSLNIKIKKIYFNFNIETNLNKRLKCYNDLKEKLEWLNNVHPVNNLIRLKDYEFCICPEGNGADTHRLWEAIYTKTVPIVIKSDFTNILIEYNVPLVVLDEWSDLDITKLNYNEYNFEDEKLLKLITFSQNYL